MWHRYIRESRESYVPHMQERLQKTSKKLLIHGKRRKKNSERRVTFPLPSDDTYMQPFERRAESDADYAFSLNLMMIVSVQQRGHLVCVANTPADLGHLVDGVPDIVTEKCVADFMRATDLSSYHGYSAQDHVSHVQPMFMQAGCDYGRLARVQPPLPPLSILKQCILRRSHSQDMWCSCSNRCPTS